MGYYNSLQLSIMESGELNQPIDWVHESFGEHTHKVRPVSEPAPRRIEYFFCSCGATFDVPESDLDPANFGHPSQCRAFQYAHQDQGHRVESTYRPES